MSLHHISQKGRPKKNSVRRDQVIIPDQHTQLFSPFPAKKKFAIQSDFWVQEKSAVIPRLYPIILCTTTNWSSITKCQSNTTKVEPELLKGKTTCYLSVAVRSLSIQTLPLGTYSFQIKSENLIKKSVEKIA